MGATSPRRAALTVLKQWDKGTQFADTLISKVDCEEHAFFNVLVMGVLRNTSLLDFWISKLRDGALQNENRWILRLGLYQLLKLKTPPHAAVNETVKLASFSGKAVVNAVMRRAANEFQDLIDAAKAQPPNIRYSLPASLLAEWATRFGEENAHKLARWMNRPAEVVVRANRLKGGIGLATRRSPKGNADHIPGKGNRLDSEQTRLLQVRRPTCFSDQARNLLRIRSKHLNGLPIAQPSARRISPGRVRLARGQDSPHGPVDEQHRKHSRYGQASQTPPPPP